MDRTTKDGESKERMKGGGKDERKEGYKRKRRTKKTGRGKEGRKE